MNFRLIGLSFTNRQTIQFKKNRTAGLSQTNARKYNRQCKPANQCKVPVTTPKKVLLADGGSSANTLGSLNFIRLLRVFITPSVSCWEEKTTRSNRMNFRLHSWLLVAVNAVLFCCFVLASCLGHLKGKCMTKLMKVCIGNNQRIVSWKRTLGTETLDKNKKTLILVFRYWHYKNKRTKSVEIVWGNEWNAYFQ